MTLVLPADLKRWAVKHLGERLKALGQDVMIETKTPKAMTYPLSKPLITVGELTPTKYDHVQWDQELAVNIRAGTRQTEITGLLGGGDLIIGVDGQTVNVFGDLLAYMLENKSPGDQMVMTIVRDNQEQEVTVTLGRRP